MSIDIAYLIVMILAIIKGWQKGLIVAVFSLIAWIIGLAAAMKFSTIVAKYLEESGHVSARWIPFLSFLIIFLGVVFVIRIVAKLIETSVELAWMGWINNAAGAFLYLIIYSILFSVALFFMIQMRLISDEAAADSVVFNFIEPWGPVVINGLGTVIPFFKDMFAELEEFFTNMAQKVPQ